MKHFIAAMILSCSAGAAAAQSWRVQGDSAIAPKPIAGDDSGGFAVVCTPGEWVLYEHTAYAPSDEDSPANVVIDGERYDAQFGRFEGAYQGIALSHQIINAMKAGNTVTVSFISGSAIISTAYTLRGSSQALNAVEAQCAFPSPATAPDRFKSAAMGSTSEAITLASWLLRPVLEEAHEVDPQVGIDGANIVDLPNGWSFLIAAIGPSTGLYGVAAFSAVTAARPPGEDWRIVAHKGGVATYIDSQGMTNGYPDIVYQSVRGVNQPYAMWQWDGQQYNFVRRIEN